ncbi:MAG: outer membrane lipoprotein LolB [Sideroxydans sp.]|nr:outer membrane lipoprotein LolB [Sideroxydans sp.]
MRGSLASLVLLLLAGCASVPPAPLPVRPVQVQSVSFALSGRIAVRYDSERSSAGVHWTHHAGSDEILLLAPLGQTVARISRNVQSSDGRPAVQQFTLDSEDKHYVAQDAESLTEQALGWRLPLAGLQYWVLALPVPGEAFSSERADNGQLSLLRQDGWTIHYTRYAAQTPDSLPLRIALERAGLQIQLLIDEWQIQ